jgi:ABC-type methionine transport system ATPase subunit
LATIDYDANGKAEQSLGFVFLGPTLLAWRTVAGSVHRPLMLVGMSTRQTRAEGLQLT